MEERNFIKTDLYRVVKLVTMLTIGAPVLAIRGTSMGLERFTPEFTEALDHSGFISVVNGNAVVYSHLIDKTMDLFDGTSIFLTKDELILADEQALVLVQEAADQGKELSLSEALIATKAILLAAKTARESVK